MGAHDLPEPSPPRARGIGARVALAATATLATLLALEVGVRGWDAVTATRQGEALAALEGTREAALTPGERASLREILRPSPIPDAVYELRPRLDVELQGVPVRTNSHGQRGPEIGREKPAGTVRIAGLGDSVMFGWGVAWEEAFLPVVARRLEGWLGDRADVEVASFAAPGYNTTMEVASFEHRALAFEPDLVVIQFLDNDLDVPHFMLRPRAEDPFFSSRLLDLALARHHRRELLPHDLGHLTDDERRRVRSRYKHMVGVAAYRRQMARLASLAAARSIPVIVVWDGGMSAYSDLVAEVVAEHRLVPAITEPYYLDYFAELGETPDLAAWRRHLFVAPKDRHPNARGHRIIAEAVLAAVEPLLDRLAGAGSESPPPSR